MCPYFSTWACCLSRQCTCRSFWKAHFVMLTALSTSWAVSHISMPVSTVERQLAWTCYFLTTLWKPWSPRRSRVYGCHTQALFPPSIRDWGCEQPSLPPFSQTECPDSLCACPKHWIYKVTHEEMNHFWQRISLLIWVLGANNTPNTMENLKLL